MRAMRNMPFWFCLIGAAVLLIFGYALAGLWWGVPAVLVMILSGWLGGRQGWPWRAHLLLAGYVGAATAGVLLGGSAYLLIAGAAAALVCWELADRKGGSDHPLAGLYERRRAALLGAAAGMGLLAAIAGLSLRFTVPFSGLVLAALLILFSLYRFFSLFRNRPNS